jgi:hypothetical protein
MAGIRRVERKARIASASLSQLFAFPRYREHRPLVRSLKGDSYMVGYYYLMPNGIFRCLKLIFLDSTPTFLKGKEVKMCLFSSKKRWVSN